MDAERPGLDSSCALAGVDIENGAGVLLDIPECTVSDQGWQLPADQPICYGILDALPQSCVVAGVNAAFEFLGTLPDNVELAIQCQYAIAPDAPCPDFHLEIDSDAPGEDQCSR